MEPLPVPEGPWEWTQSDYITRLPTGYGFNAIHIVMDHFTKMGHSTLTTDKAAANDTLWSSNYGTGSCMAHPKSMTRIADKAFMADHIYQEDL